MMVNFYIYIYNIIQTSLLDDVSDKLAERLVANLVGKNQLSFIPCNSGIIKMIWGKLNRYFLPVVV
jgi:hypothetical protein